MRRVQYSNSPLVRFSGSCRIAAITMISVVLLTACTGDGMDDLREFVAAEKAKPAGRIPPLPVFETYVTVPYAAANLRDPFIPFMIAEPSLDEGKGKKVAKNTTKPPITHKPQALEKFPLDGLKFVGLLEKKGETWAIIAAPDKLVYRVSVGNYLGENYGKIISISETKIEMIEKVDDGMGGWVDRPATLSVAE